MGNIETISKEEYQERMEKLDIIKKKYLECVVIFDKHKNNSEIGVHLTVDDENFLNKTGNELIKNEELMQCMKSIRSINYHNILHKPVRDYGLTEWLICVDEGLFVEYAVYMLSKVLAVNPYAIDHRGIPILIYISLAYKYFEFSHKKEWYSNFKTIICTILNGERPEAFNNNVCKKLQEFIEG